MKVSLKEQQRLGLPRRFVRSRRGLPLVWLHWVMFVALNLVTGWVWYETGKFPWMAAPFIAGDVLASFWQPLFFRQLVMDIELSADAVVVHRLHLPYEAIRWSDLQREGHLVEIADNLGHSVWVDLDRYEPGLWECISALREIFVGQV